MCYIKIKFKGGGIMYKRIIIFFIIGCFFYLPTTKAGEQEVEEKKSGLILGLPRIEIEEGAVEGKGRLLLRAYETKELKGLKIKALPAVEGGWSCLEASKWLPMIRTKGGYTIKEMGPKITTLEFNPPEGKAVKVGFPTYPVTMVAEAVAPSKEVKSERPVFLAFEEITSFFKGKDVEIEKIEIWVKGGAETGGLTRLIISAKADAGIKVILKPKK